MSCKNATSPIDIKNNNNVLNCRGKCNLNYQYNQIPSNHSINPYKIINILMIIF